MTHNEVHYTSKELLEFLIFTSRGLGSEKRKKFKSCGIIVEGTNLGQVKFLEMGPINRESGFMSQLLELKQSANSLLDWLTKIWIKRMIENELEMPDSPWITVDEDTQTLEK